MSNLSTKILMIFLLLRVSNSLDCHKCNKGHSAFLPVDQYENGIEYLEQLIEGFETGETSSEDVKKDCQLPIL